MKLQNLLEGLNYEVIQGNIEKDITGIEYDSRNIKEGYVFFCIKGFKTDGHKYVKKAIQNGAKVIICQNEIEKVSNDINIIKCKDTRKALAVCSSNYYGNPKEKIKFIGVTGTNGKTTSAFMIKAILEDAGYKVGLIGTIANYIGNKKIHTERTTPESLELHKLFKEMVEAKVDYCVMEVSSHSLSLDRVYGINYSEAIFTNLTRDHLDFHKTFENYFNAKLKLFTMAKNSIINIDDKYGKVVLEKVKNNIITYGINEKCSLKCENMEIHSRGIEFELLWKDEKEKIYLGIPGKYNIYNALGSIGACLNERVSLKNIKKAIEKVQVPGRCELVTKDYNLGFDVIVDYAHTPDGLENILNTAKEFTKGRLISVFGCGGDRDKTKRPIMGEIGSELSEIAIITSDNPRTEDPMEIIKDILKGMKKENYIVIENRKEAIKKAMKIAQKDDVIVIAGKGHEDYQILNDSKIHFDEREIVLEIIKELF